MSNQLILDFKESTEAEKKARILNNFENNHPAFLEEARRLARHCCHKNLGLKLYRLPHTVCADYIRREMFIERGLPGGNNLLGSVFRVGFIKVGAIASKADGDHGREVKLWTLPEYIDVVKSFQARAA